MAAPPPSEQLALVEPDEDEAEPDEDEAKQAEECCAICLGPPEEPQPFPNADCPHVFCSACLSTLHQHLEGNVVPCPTCRRPSTLGSSAPPQRARDDPRLVAALQESRRLAQRRRVAQEQRRGKRVLVTLAVGLLTMAMACGFAVGYVIRAGSATQFAASYTFTGCADAAHCGEYVQIYPPVLCSEAPAYQLNSSDGQTRVLYRITTESDGTTCWYVPTPGHLTDDEYLRTCKHQPLGDLHSDVTLALGGPDSHSYLGWQERVVNRWAALQPGEFTVVGNFEERDDCASTGCGDAHNFGAAGGGR